MLTIEQVLQSPSLLVLLCLAALFIGLSKGGLPAIAMLSVPLLTMILSPLTAAILLLPIYIVSDVVGVWLYRREYSAPNLKILIPAGITGVILGWATAAIVSDSVVTFLLGCMGIVFCLYQWFLKPANAAATSARPIRGFFWGTLSGFTSFVAHAGAPPFQVYVLPQKLPKMVFAGTTTIVFAAVNLAKVIPYSALQPYNRSTLLLSACLLPIAAVGTVLGKHLTLRLSERWFFLAVQIALFLISIRLVTASL